MGAQGFGTPGHEIAAVSTDGGLLWASTAPLSGVTHLDAMACATPSSCLAVGSNLVGSSTEGVAVSTADGGHTWSTMSTLPAGAAQLKDVSCPIATSCMVVGTSTDENRGRRVHNRCVRVAVDSPVAARWRVGSFPRDVPNGSILHH